MGKRSAWHETIDIDATPTAVYDVMSDLTKDPLWRTEVNRMDVQGPRELGTVATEYSTLFFGRFVKTVTATEIVALDPPRLLAVETPAGAKTWLRSERRTTPRGNRHSTFTYDLSTEVSLGGPLGAIYGGILHAAYKPRLSRYLQLLKDLVEAENHPSNNASPTDPSTKQDRE